MVALIPLILPLSTPLELRFVSSDDPVEKVPSFLCFQSILSFILESKASERFSSMVFQFQGFLSKISWMIVLEIDGSSVNRRSLRAQIRIRLIFPAELDVEGRRERGSSLTSCRPSRNLFNHLSISSFRELSP